MGFWGGIGNRVRGALRWDKEKVVLNLAKGGTASSYPSTGFDLLQAYGYDVLSDYLKLEHDLMSRYVDYEEMDDYPELATAIDIYADDATQTDSMMNKTLWVDAPDKTVQAVLTDLYDKRLRMEEEAWSICRTLVKYGNNYEELLVAQNGVVGTNFLPPPTMRRIEGRRGELFGFVQDFKGRFGYSPDEFKQLLTQRMGSQSNRAFDKYAALEDWEVVHMRLRSKHRRAIYGFSTLEPARWIWKRLMLLEDAAMVYRLQRAPERYAFYVDVGDMPPKEAMAHLHKVRQQYKKTKFYNPQTGKLDLKYNPLSQDEDFFLPIRKGVQGSKIEVLSGPNWQHMDDINYFRLKLFASIKVPKAYLGYDSATGKSTGANDDVRFARTVLRTQRELRNGLKKIGRVHLAALGINPGAVDYEVNMTVPSSIFELAQLEVRNAKADFAGRMSQFVSLHWILQKVFALSEEDIKFVIKERHEEALLDAEVQAKAMGMQLDVQNQGQQQAMDMQQQGQQAISNAVKAEPGTKKAEDAHARLREFTQASRLWSQIRQGKNFQPIHEQELFHGNRDHERKMEDKLGWMQENGMRQNKNLEDLGGLLRELTHSRSRPGNSQ